VNAIAGRLPAGATPSIWVLMTAACAVLVACSGRLDGPERMLLAMGVHVAGFKLLSLPRARRLLFLAWPGMDPRPFEAPRVPDLSGTWLLGRGCATMAIGLAIFALPCPQPVGRAWLAMAGAIAVVHLGLFDAMAGLLRWYGIAVDRICPSPWCARSLAEFWSARWNLAFHVFARDHVYRPVAARRGRAAAVAAVFLFSGLVHELVISFPAGGGWGLPTLYFAIHGLAVILEKRGVLRPSRALTAALVLAPLPILFHAPFVANVVLPLVMP
jgi:alginate O-acetyltransferase complex protein AlgI